ncbi:MAG: hypothetical protein PHY09_00485 [Desulfuromonadaceae bacterium]|nr:hypothetical protein [Desulfuromonadaceae bacterium]MDD5106520.1 hypothetical protein [Desulfuromonadaceae bacterium]
MAEVPDDIEKLLSDVRKTICDNKQFIEKLTDDAVEIDRGDERDSALPEEGFEEL